MHNFHASIIIIPYILFPSSLIYGVGAGLFISMHCIMHNDAIILSASTSRHISATQKSFHPSFPPPKPPTFLVFLVFYTSSLAELFVVIYYYSYLLLLLFNVSFITGRWQYLKHSWQLALAVTWLQPDIATSPTTSHLSHLFSRCRLSALDDVRWTIIA